VFNFCGISHHYCGNGLVYLFSFLDLMVSYHSQNLALFRFLNFDSLIVKLQIIVVLIFIWLLRNFIWLLVFLVFFLVNYIW
jgi:hypothetical protein